jgi:hypothetical protein
MKQGAASEQLIWVLKCIAEIFLHLGIWPIYCIQMPYLKIEVCHAKPFDRRKRRIELLPKQNSDFPQFGSMALHAGGIRYV